MFATITFEEVRTIAPRVALYTAVAYLTIRGVSAAVKQVSRLAGVDQR